MMWLVFLLLCVVACQLALLVWAALRYEQQRNTALASDVESERLASEMASTIVGLKRLLVGGPYRYAEPQPRKVIVTVPQPQPNTVLK